MADMLPNRLFDNPAGDIDGRVPEPLNHSFEDSVDQIHEWNGV